MSEYSMILITDMRLIEWKNKMAPAVFVLCLSSPELS